MIIDKLSGSRVHFEVHVSKEQFEHGLDHAFAIENEKVTIKGFRKGKAPRSIYEAKYGVESLYEEAIQHVLQETYYNTVMENEIDVVAQPQIDLDINKVKRGEDFSYKVTVAIRPEIKLGEYKNLKVELLPVEPSKAEIEAEIGRKLEQNAEMVIKEEGVIASGDTAVFDFSGSVNGEKFEGGTAENHEMVIGSGSFIPGFEDQMIGMASGEEKDVIVTFPEDYQEKSLAGKEAVFAVKIHEIKQRVVPTLDEDFVKELNLDGVDTVEAYKQHVLEEMKAFKEKQNEEHLRQTVIAKATENAEFDLPVEMIKDEAKTMKENTMNQIKQYGLDFNMYLQYMGKTEEEFEKELEEQAKKTLSEQFVVNEIAKAEGLTASKEEIENKYLEIVEQYKSQNVTLEQAKNAIPESAIVAEITYKKALDLIVSSANQVK
ncbi:MAG: trigger factor [Candidatus Izemoplasmatales bacterium]|jgi:trigger factor|nr:trigger factor [Candidatus Izemoplasmatales bacterium]